MRLTNKSPVFFVLLIASLWTVSVVAGDPGPAPVKGAAKKSEAAPVAAKSADAKAEKLETATLAAGCFWGVEEFYRKTPGVMKAQVGYMGGNTNNPKYEQMHDGKTNHAESVELQFDPKKITYAQILDLFFKFHDPTTMNQQGNDKGTQYRSAIFYQNDEQKKQAQEFIAKVEASKAWKSKIVTEVTKADKFWPAEEEHQDYLVKHPGGYDNHFLRPISFDTAAQR